MDARILIIFLIAAWVKEGHACRNGWVANEDTCYYFSHGESTWGEASATCLALQSHLAMVTSSEEHTFLINHLKQLNDDHDHTRYWIDGTDLEVENIWRWALTGDKLTYINWADGEPNNAQSGDCMNLYQDGGFKMADDSCEKHLYYICQENAGLVIG
ncbi:perlucin-like [Argopecten irradians]|uniref:perlucin-like n=1 Tax=Argopecten irradians TaxID=31199 RepID=UPI003715B505